MMQLLFHQVSQRRNLRLCVFFAQLCAAAFVSTSCQPPRDSPQGTGFTYMPSSTTGVSFENRLTNSNDFNIIQYLYFYNGGGVAAGDINNDGLTDLYFSSNQQSNKLYLNKGNFKFEDITERSQTTGYGNWKTGVTMADVNGDGWLDIYLCGVGRYKGFFGFNQLYINNGDLTFTEKARDYGLAFEGFSTQSAFFDYDNDGDLDMYLLNHSVHSTRSYGSVILRAESDPLAGDRLFRNDLVPTGTTHFTEVTAVAGIFSSQVGYGLGVGISDLDNNGYADIYVSNDFHENDYMYLNNGNGTFRQVLERSMPHTSRFSMGNDIADINEDGWNDIVTLDMFPSDENVIKTTTGEDNYEIFQYKLRFGYHHQVSRNTMQVNLGPVDSAGGLLFSDVAPMAGVAATDWSWAALLADFDNDGSKDLFITNGIAGRPNDLDYINYISNDSAQRRFTDEQLFSKMPSGSVPNVMYRNTGRLRFEDVSKKWLNGVPSLSNGAAYADLDNDGDLDLAVNNINTEAFVMRNDLPKDSLNYLKLKFEGTGGNRFGVGASAKVYAGNGVKYREQYNSRGWISSVEPVVHVGLGTHTQADSIRIIWPGGKSQLLTNVAANAIVTIKEPEAGERWSYRRAVAEPLLLEAPRVIPWKHSENDYDVLESQRLAPHMNSTRGPCIVVGDVNGDRLDDVFIGGGQKQAGSIFLQTNKGKFVLKPQPAFDADAACEDTAAALFDIDGDRDLDLMVGGGGEQFLDRRILLRLYENNGKGVFTRVTEKERLQKFYVNASCIAPADVDNDKDMDVFVGGGVVTGRYGLNSDSFILINDGKGNFKETPSTFEGNKRPLGIVQAAVWTDNDGDSYPELAITGEWMSLEFWKNHAGQLKLEMQDDNFGWWNSLIATDMDGDSDKDFVAGNFGWNGRLQIPTDDSTHLRKSTKEYVGILISDLDANSDLDQILTYPRDGIRYPVLSRDQLVRQVPSMKKKYLKYSDFAHATADDMVRNTRFTEKKVTTFSSLYLETSPDPKRLFVTELPEEAQSFPVYAIQAIDINGDGLKDLLLGGNLYSVQPELWRHDAGYGLVLLAEKTATGVKFVPISPRKSGFILKGEVRSIQSLTTATREQLILVGLNNDSLMVFKKRK